MVEIISFSLLGIVSGLFGGTLRAMVGLVKQTRQKKVEFKIGYILFTLFVSMVAGSIAGALIDGNWIIYFLAGYAGSDLIDGLSKMIIKKQSQKS